MINFDLEKYYDQGKRVLIDIKDQLHNGFVLREKEFRLYVNEVDWTVYKDMNVAITCSTDAIVPTWSYMLLSTAITPFAKNVVFGDLTHLENNLFQKALDSVHVQDFADKKVIIKGNRAYFYEIKGKVKNSLNNLWKFQK